MRRDLIHTPSVQDDEGSCAACGTWLPLDVAVSALKASGAAVLEVGGLGAFCVALRDTLGREAISCMHPSVAAQAREITVSPCPICQDYRKAHERNVEGCETCGGTGMIALIPDPDDPDNPQIMTVSTNAPDESQLKSEGLTVERVPTSTDFEKQISQGIFANWLGMREKIHDEMDGL